MARSESRTPDLYPRPVIRRCDKRDSRGARPDQRATGGAKKTGGGGQASGNFPGGLRAPGNSARPYSISIAEGVDRAEPVKEPRSARAGAFAAAEDGSERTRARADGGGTAYLEFRALGQAGGNCEN